MAARKKGEGETQPSRPISHKTKKLKYGPELFEEQDCAIDASIIDRSTASLVDRGGRLLWLGFYRVSQPKPKYVRVRLLVHPLHNLLKSLLQSSKF